MGSIPTASTNILEMMITPNVGDAYGFGSKYKLPAHRADVTTCPCLDCKRVRGVGAGLKAMFGEIKWILYLKWMLWQVKRDRAHWEATHTANPEELDKEELDEG